jgi:hypothetical protein
VRRASAVLAFLLAGSCLLDRRSTDFECTQSTDCETGRVCEGGFCIRASLDCDGARCSANCDDETPCGALVCPAGFSCNFDCDSPGACTSIDCSEAAFCDIDCTAPNACGPVVCGRDGTGECDIECTAQNACAGITCDDACKCDVDCDIGGDGCEQPSTCPATGVDCDDGDNGCDSSDAGCDTCS